MKELNVNIVHTGKKIKDLYILSTSTSYVDRMNINDDVSI